MGLVACIFTGITISMMQTFGILILIITDIGWSKHFLVETDDAADEKQKDKNATGGGNGSSEFVCQFSPDCYSHPLSPYHGQMMDGPLVCIHGKCDIMTDVVGEMCRGYNECDCRSNPEKCFCIMRECENRAWECHESKDCERMKKCKGKRCVCGGDSGATCEIDRNSGGNGTSVEEKLCEFTSDCPVHSFANYACNHGKCVSKGDALYDLCRDYTECDCRSNPEKCFCIMGQCENRAWECHKHRDCDRMKKCKGKRCVCRGTPCEISWAVPLNSGQGDVKHGEDYDDEDVNGDGEKARGPGRSV